MTDSKCSRCHRRDDCALSDLAQLTLPWVIAATDDEGSEWELAHSVLRALRGNGSSPGFVEDWKLAGAMQQRDVDALVKAIITKGRVDMGVLTRSCRHYVGPDASCDDRAAA